MKVNHESGTKLQIWTWQWRKRLVLRAFLYIFILHLLVLDLEMIFMCLVSSQISYVWWYSTRYHMGKRHFSSEGKRIPEVTESQVQFVFFSCSNIFQVVNLFWLSFWCLCSMGIWYRKWVLVPHGSKGRHTGRIFYL